MHGTQKSPSPSLTNPRLFDTDAIPANPPQPDPSAHARALLESYGRRGALQIARSNASFTSFREDYWPRVLAAMERQARSPRSKPAPCVSHTVRDLDRQL